MCSAPRLFSTGGLLGSPCVSVKADRHVLCDLKERLEQPSFERCVFISVLTCLTFCLRELGEASDNCYSAVFSQAEVVEELEASSHYSLLLHVSNHKKCFYFLLFFPFFFVFDKCWA